MTQQHLTPQEIARCADSINRGTYSTIPANLREHLVACEQCADELLAVTELTHDTLSVDMTPERAPIFKPSIPRGIIKYTLAAAALIVAVIVLIESRNDTTTKYPDNHSAHTNTPVVKKEIQNDKPDTIQPVIKTPVTQKRELLAQFKPNHKLELLVENYQYPSRWETGMSIYDEVLRKPVLTADSLCWPQETPGEHVVEILNNQNKLIHNLHTTTGCVYIPDLEPGLYYWKVINKDYDLLFVGKIVKEPEP